MHSKALVDPAPITRFQRAVYSSRILVAAVCHLKVFEILAKAPLPRAGFAGALGLKDRPAKVLLPALRAMGLLSISSTGFVEITPLGRHLCPDSVTNLVGYLGLEQEDPGIQEMARRLQNDGPVVAPSGIAYVKEGQEPSPMDDPILARQLTLALSGRARQLAPFAAAAMPRSSGHLLDAAGGSGLFALEWLRLNPHGTATVFDRPEVLKVAREFKEEFCDSPREGAASVRQRIQFQPGDMLEDELPRADLVLAASLFHDWPEPTCFKLAQRFAEVLKPGGELWIHDAFLNDSMDGPLAVTDYSAQLFWVTKGRCYSRAEYRRWFREAELEPTSVDVPTAMDYSLISARRS